MFGFERLAGLSLRLEQAAESGSADAKRLADAVCNAIAATRAEMQTLTLQPLDQVPVSS
jgi:hypothetical protein